MGIQFSGGLRIVPNIHNGVGYYYLFQQYAPAYNPGMITFPDHANGVGSLNPNEIGQQIDGTATQLYINVFDSENTDNTTYLQQLVGNHTRLTLSQGSNFIVFECTEQSFVYVDYFGDIIYDDSEVSLFGSVTIVTSATSNFNTVDPINIHIEVLAPSSTPTPTPTPQPT